MNLLDLYAKITLDDSEYRQKIGDAEENAGGLAASLKSGFATVAKVGAAGLSAAAAAATALGKASVEGYAEYEQLIGGVETLYGAEAQSLEEYAKSVGKAADEVGHEYEMMMNRQSDVMKNAANAYKTAGLSANEYMETVNGFAASLTASLGEYEWEAAGYADMIVTDMADNANKMGTSMESIQNAYSGFAKQNYTMLDNLKLGYGGTKEEMERLLRDAEEYAGYIEGSLDISSFADVAEAINIVQNELGIAGTTAKEASATISGSISTMKSAWGNLVTGMADDNADMGQLIANFVDSAVTVAGNIIPRVKVVIGGMVDMVHEMAPRVIDSGKNLLTSLTDGVVQNVPDMLSRIPEVFTSFFGFITAKLPEVLDKGVEVLNNLVNGVLRAIPDMLSKLPEVFDAFVSFVAQNLPVIASAGADILVNLISGIIKTIPKLVARIPEIIASFVETVHKNLPSVIRAGYDLLMKLGDGIFDALPQLLEDLPGLGEDILEAMAKALEGIVDIGADIVRGLWDGITGMAGWLGEKVTGFFDGLFDDVKENEEIHSPSKKWAYIGKNDALGFGDGWLDGLKSVEKSVTSGLDFGVETVSAPAQTAQSAVDNSPREIVINLTSEMDGAVVARKTHRYNLRESNLRGGSLVEVYG